MGSKPALAFIAATLFGLPSALGMASAELYYTKAYQYGRFDARIQYAPGDGVVSSFFLWKDGSDAAGAYWNELDYEKNGANCAMQINNIYGNPKTQHQQTPSLGAICTGYHDYRFEWTPTYIAWVVDGKEIRRDTGAAATAYAQNATAGMTIHFNIWPGNSSFGGNINNTTLPVHQYISWVEYASYDNGNFTVQWHEDFQGSSVPSGWAVGNWSSPFNLSTHNPQNVGFVNGIAVLSLTADNATGNPGTPPADSEAGGSGGAAGSSGAGGASGTGGSAAGGTVAAGAGGAVGAGGKPAAGGSGGGAGGASGSGPGAGGSTGSGGAATTGGNPAGGTSTSSSASSSGGTSASAGSTMSGGTGTGGTTHASGGTSTSGGPATSGGVTESGGTTSTGAPTGAGGSTGGEATGGQSGCSCNLATPRVPRGLALLVSLAAMATLLRRRKK